MNILLNKNFILKKKLIQIENSGGLIKYNAFLTSWNQKKDVCQAKKLDEGFG